MEVTISVHYRLMMLVTHGSIKYVWILHYKIQ